MDSVGDTIGDLSIKAEAFDLGNNMPINKKPKDGPNVQRDPSIKPDSSKVTKEVHTKLVLIIENMKERMILDLQKRTLRVLPHLV